MTIETTEQPARRLTPLDYMAIVAGVINFLVIGSIVGFWWVNN